MARKYFYFVVTAAIVVILGLIHSLDYVARYQRSPDETHGMADLRELQEPPEAPTRALDQLSINSTGITRTSNGSVLTIPVVRPGSDVVRPSSDVVRLGGDAVRIRRPVVIFNVMPKSGSRTLYELVTRLKASTRPEIVMMNTMGGFSQTHVDKVHDIREFVYQSKVGFLYSHMRYHHLSIRDKDRNPTFISIVRDPIDRLASLYYFVRFGDNIDDQSNAGKEFREKMTQMNYSSETFSECVMNGGLTCRDPGALVRHFCGADKKVCSNAKAKTEAYDRAVATIDKHYAAIGIMEDYVAALRVFEALVPGLFGGVTEMYLQEKAAILSMMKTKNKPPMVSNLARKLLRKEMGHDYRLFNYIRNKFHKLKIQLGIAVNAR